MSTLTSQTKLPTWRRIALSTWKQGDDPSIFGSIDVDATELLAWLERTRAATGVRVTVTHLVGKAAAIAFAESPECNAVASYGRLLRRSTVDVFFSVAVGNGKDLSGAKIESADRLTVPEIALALDRDVGVARTSGDTALQRSQSTLKKIPSFLMGPALRATAAAMYDLGLDLGALGVPFDPFGSVVVTNVGVFGIERGFAPLIPTGRTAALLTIGKVHDGVVAKDGRAVVRPVLSIGGTFDHRVVDGYHLGRIAGVLRRVLENPAAALGEPAQGMTTGTTATLLA
jgi:pyruvate/2-oxoglutarate dehydrogenase complex dihydrolipoamide acyltransferase (E2) component